MIPDSYISSGERPERLYDGETQGVFEAYSTCLAGTIEISGKMSGEKRDCLH